MLSSLWFEGVYTVPVSAVNVFLSPVALSLVWKLAGNS